MQEINHKNLTIRGNADGKRPRNGWKSLNILKDKIGVIFSCSKRVRKASLHECARGKEHGHGVALNKTQKKQVDAGRRRNLTANLSMIFRKNSIGFNTRKWKAIRIGSKGRVLKPGLARKRDVRREERTREVDDERIELCKRRILMGEKCRALNLSGVLHYDDQGILLPEDDV